MNLEKAKPFVPIALSAVLGLVAAGLGYTVIKSNKPMPTARVVEKVELVDMVVAKVDIVPGTPLTAENLTTVQVTPAAMPLGGFNSTKDLLAVKASADVDSAMAAGPRVAMQPIKAGQTILASALAEWGTGQGLASILPKGTRAMKIKVDPISGMGEFLQPESRVDIVSTIGSGEKATTVAVAQNVRVIAVNDRLGGMDVEEESDADKIREERRAGSVTLQVTTDEAAAIDLASNQGVMRLILRAGGDDNVSEWAGMTLAHLRGEVDHFEGEPYMQDTFIHDTDDGTTLAPAAGNPTTRPAGTFNPAAAEQGDIAATDTTRPIRLKPHVVEIIRAGVTTTETLAPTKNAAGQAYAGNSNDAFGD